MHKIVAGEGSALFAKEGVSLYKSSYMQQGKDFPFYVIPERFGHNLHNLEFVYTKRQNHVISDM